MKNEFIYEGIVSSIQEKVSSNGNEYWIVGMDGDKSQASFVFFQDQPTIGKLYRVIGKLKLNDRGYLQTSVSKIVALEATVPVATAPPPPPAQPPIEEISDSDLPF